MATIETRKTQIKDTFRSHRAILDESASIKPIDSRGKTVSLIYVPRDVNLNNPSEGVPLKEGVGFLSLREEVDNNGNVLGYLYRFTSDEYIYIAEKKNYGVDDWMKEGFFNFHYQKDQQHDGPHVSFLHSSIRYISREIDLNEFLDFIERTFFVNGSRNNSLPWHSRF